MPKKPEKGASAQLPGTLKRSTRKAQAVYERTLESAEAQYGGDEARAHRVAWGAVKNGFEKIGDHWETKSQTGPSDSRSAAPHAAKLAGAGETFGGVDVLHHSRAELLERARGLGVMRTSKLTKTELAREIAKKQR